MEFARIEIFVIFVVVVLCATEPVNEKYSERVRITTLDDGKLSINFELQSDITKVDSEHYSLFPKQIKRMITTHNVREMHLSMTQGRWNYEKWGTPQYGAPVGAELVVWFTNSTSLDISKSYKGLIHAISGLFCASLNFFDLPNSKSYASGIVTNRDLFRYATLSNEVVCTENLTPFKNLLSSRGKCGIGALLNPIKLYDTHFHSMGVHIDTNHGVRLIQTVSLVVDAKNGINFGDWSLSKLFGVKSIARCPFSDKTSVFISKRNGLTLGSVDISPKGVEEDNHFVIEVPNEPIDVSVVYKKNEPLILGSPSLVNISAVRYEKSFGLHGVMTTRIKNHSSKNITISYYDAIPWYFRVYFSTIRFTLNDGILPSFPISRNVARDRVTPYEIEFQYDIPAQSQLDMTLEFDKLFLQITDHSPDAHRGFDLSSSIVTWGHGGSTFDWSQNGIENSTICRYYTESLLIMLPTPDFSMPYNVICLSCTVIALFMGSMFNTLLNPKDVKEDETKEGDLKKKNE
jgi:phosphatidylinositol glycan class T